MGVWAIAALLMLAAVVMFLWNGVLLSIFDGVRRIDYLQALGLLLLCRILGGGYRGAPRWYARHPALWEIMTRDERASFGRTERHGGARRGGQ
jgi:hypothetical protein